MKYADTFQQESEIPPSTPMKDEGYTPSVQSRSASFSSAQIRPVPPFAAQIIEGSFSTPNQDRREESPVGSGRRGPYPDLGPGPGQQTQNESFRPTPPFVTPNYERAIREQSPASSGRRGPYPDLGPGPSQGSPQPTPTKRRSSWLPHFGRSPSRGKSGDSQQGNMSTPRRAFSHDVTSILSRQHHGGQETQEQRQGSFDGGHRFRPPFFHHRSGSNASSQQYASPQNSFGPQYASPQNSFGPDQRPPFISKESGSFGRQRSDSLPLPPGAMIDAREVSSVASNTPPPLAVPMATQIHLDLPETRLRDGQWLSTSPANTSSPHPSSTSPHPSSHPSSRHPSGVPSMTESERLEVADKFDINKELPKPDLDDHEHTGVKPPVPIGKYQPSWDPFNATPIKEEGSEYSFGKGSVSPPKISPPVLESVEERGATIDATKDNAVLAGSAGIGLAAGVATTVAAISDLVEEEREARKPEVNTMEVGEDDVYQIGGSRQERKTQVSTTEIDEEDLYDASPPPKSKRRSLGLKPDPPVALAAGTATTAAAIREQARELNDADTPDREEGIYDASQPPRSTVTAIQEQLQERKADDEESGIYDAPPPPKSKRRSLDFRSAPEVPVGVAAGTFTTVAAIREQVQEFQERKYDGLQERDDDWEVISHSDAPAVVKDEPSYFPPVAPITSTPPQPEPQVFDQRLGLDHTKHSRNISSVSAVSALTDTNLPSPGELVQAESVTIIRQPSPVERQIHDTQPATLSNIHQFMRTTSDDSPLTPPLPFPRPPFIGQQQAAQHTSTPTMESVPGFFPETPSASVYDAPRSIKTASEVRAASDRWVGVTDKPLPPIDKRLPYEHPDDNNVTPTPTQLSANKWEPATSQVELREPAKREDTSSVSSEEEDDEKPYAAALARLDNVRNNTQHIGSELQPQQGMVMSREMGRGQRGLDEGRRYSQQGMVQSREQDPRRRGFDEAEQFGNQNAGSKDSEPIQWPFDVTERFWVPDAQQISDEHPQQQDMMQLREQETGQRSFDEADQFRVQNERTVNRAGVAGTGIQREDIPSVVSEEDDEKKPYVETLARLDNVRNNTQKINDEVQPQQGMVVSKEQEPSQRAFDEAERFRVQNAQTVHQQQSIVQSNESQPRLRSFDEAERLRLQNAQRLHNVRNDTQQSREPEPRQPCFEEPEEYSVWNAQAVPQPQQGMVESRETETRQQSFNEAERFCVQNAQQIATQFHPQQSMVRPRESQPGQRSDEAEELRLQNARTVEKAGVGLGAGAMITSQIIPRQIQENREDRRVSTTEIDDDDIYGEKSIYNASQPPKSKRRSLDMRPTVALDPAVSSSPPPRPTSGAVGHRGSPTGVTPVLAPQPGPGQVPFEFTSRSASAAAFVQPAPPSLGQERIITPRSPLGVAPVQQQRQFPQPLHHNQNQNQTAYQQSAYPIGGTPYNQLPQSQPPGPPRGQHQAYAAQLAQGPPQLKKSNSAANRHVLQKRPSSAASSNKGKEVKEKRKSFFSGLFGGRRRSAMAEKEKEKEKDGKVPLVAVLGAAGVAARHQNPEQKQYQEQQRRLSWQQMTGVVIPQNQGQDQGMSLQQMSGAIPPPNQQFEARDPRFLQWQQGQQQPMQAPPGRPQKILQGGPQPQQQQYDSPPIPGPYAHVRGDGSYGPINQGPMILNPHQQQQVAALRQSQQPVFADRRSYDEYMRQQQAAQAQQQGHYANLPPPPAQSYTQGRQESVPPNFRRASQEYVRDLNQRSSQEYRRDSNPVAGGQQLSQTYTQKLAAQRPASQRKEQIAVAIPAWKRAIRDTPGTTSPVPITEPSPSPVLGPQGDFPHLTAYNANSNKSPDTPEPQGRSRPFLGLNDDRRNSNLSTEDLLARSPARAQFGQQAPYQLSLPGGDDDGELDSPHSRRAPPNALVGAVAAAAAAGHRERQQASSPLRENQHQHQAMNVPLPETAFSPMAERGMRGEDVAPPPIPKWSAPPTPSGMAHNVQLGHPQHHIGAGLLQPAGQPLLYPQNQNQMLLAPNVGGVGRSNTVMSDVSSITVDSTHTPSPRQHALATNATGHGHNKSISTTSPIFGQQLSPMTTHDSVSPRSSPNDTPVVGNAMTLQPSRPSVPQSRTEPVVQRIHIPSDIPSSVVPPAQPQQAPPMPTARAPSPPHQAIPAANATGGFVVQDDRAQRPTVVTQQQHPDHSGLIYDNSREGLIVVEDATVRRVNQGQVARTPDDDEAPVMSATSFPGDEWRPYGWDDGGYD